MTERPAHGDARWRWRIDARLRCRLRGKQACEEFAPTDLEAEGSGGNADSKHRESAPASEIDPKSEYEVTLYPTYAPSKRTIMVGAELQRLRIEIADRPGSLLVEYKRINH